MGFNKSNSKNEVYNNKYLYQEKRSEINLTLYLKKLEKEQTKSKMAEGKEIMKINAERNETKDNRENQGNLKPVLKKK